MRSLALLILAVPMAVQAGALNDTGMEQCAITQADGSCTYPEDAAQGRDAAAAAGVLPKIGGGSKGFDFTKIANNGSVLPASATLGPNPTDWACTYDNTTGLMWEVKTTDGGPRDWGYSYTWYDSIHNYEGDPGISSGTTNCKASGRCDTEKFVTDMNAAGLCGHTDWRIPKVTELAALVVLTPNVSPRIDGDFFPNTVATGYWTDTPILHGIYGSSASGIARAVDFWTGDTIRAGGAGGVGSSIPRSCKIRLVRGGLQ